MFFAATDDHYESLRKNNFFYIFMYEEEYFARGSLEEKGFTGIR